MTRRGTPTHVHRTKRKVRGNGAKGWGETNGAVVHRFVETERPVVGNYRLLSAEGVLLAAGPDEPRLQQMARAMGNGAHVEQPKRRGRAA